MLQVLFVIAILFPYIQLIPIGTDVQPIAMCLAVLIILTSREWVSAPPHFWLLGVVFLVAIVVLMIGEIEFSALRSLGNYASLFLIALASYSCARQVQPMTFRFLKIANWIWFGVGIVQSLFFTEFLYPILPEVRRTASRGVVSLAAEPGYYATMSLFFLFTLFLYNRERSLHGLLCIIQITLLARSTLITVILLVAILVYGIAHLSVKTILTLTAMLAAGWLLGAQTDYFENTRMGELTKLARSNPSDLTKLDLSISDRVGQLVFSVKGAVVNYLVPNGFTSWGAYYHSEMLKAGDYFVMYYGDPYPKRIQSGIGGPLYELGLFGAIPIWVLFAGIRHHFESLRKGPAVVFAIAIVLSLLPGTPIATPIYGFLLGQLFAFRRANFVVLT